MKITIDGKKISLVPESEMDFFWVGVISSKNKAVVLWEDGVIQRMIMEDKDLIRGLGCVRD